MKKNDKFNDALAYALLSPTIVDPRWPEIPEHLRHKALMYRILLAPKCVEEQMSTEFDALVYLHTASLSVPLDYYWRNVYFYLFKKFFPKHAETLGQNVQLQIPNELSDYEKYLLNDLRHWLFKVQMRAVKEKLRGKREEKLKDKRVVTAPTTTLDRWLGSD